MSKSALRDMVFARYEERRAVIIKKRNQWQQQLDEDTRAFGEAFGQEAVESLGDTSLRLKAAAANMPSGNQQPEQPSGVVEKRGKRRRRRSRKAATNTPKINWKELIVGVLKGTKRGLKAEEIRAKLPPTESGKHFSVHGFQGCLNLLTHGKVLRKEDKKYFLNK